MPERVGHVEYPHPPIEEGLCQVTFVEPLKWNVTTPGRIYEALQAEYPADPEGQEQVEASLGVGEKSDMAASLALNRAGVRYLLRDDTGKRLAVVNPGSYSVNSQRPYEGWPSLRSRLSRDLARLGDVTSVPGIAMVTLRYINRVIVPQTGIDTDEYFTVPIRTAQGGEAYVQRFLYRVESLLRDDETTVVLTYGDLNSGAEESAFVIDLEVRRNLESGSLEDALALADDLKRIENLEFESLITEKTRGLFQ